MAKIRVGMIRCDTHGAYFGPQMDEHDPLFFRQPLPPGDERARGNTWLMGGNHYYFYTYYADATRWTAPRVDAFRIVKVWDENPFVAQMARKLFYDRPEVCENFEQASDDVDLVFISDCGGDGHDHLRLATPGLKKGVPTFVDKPFAHRLADVKALLTLADKHDTPLMSLSILQCVPAVHAFRQGLATLGDLQYGTVQGGGTVRAGLIHSVCFALTAFGPGVAAVRAVKARNHTSVHLEYEDGRGPANGVMINCDVGPGWHGNFHASAFGPGYPGAMHGRGVGDWEFPQGSAEILRLVEKMVRTGKPQGPVDQQIEGVAVCDAADKAIAANDGRPVKVKRL